MGQRVAVSELWAAEMLKEGVEEHVHLYSTLSLLYILSFCGLR